MASSINATPHTTGMWVQDFQSSEHLGACYKNAAVCSVVALAALGGATTCIGIAAGLALPTAALLGVGVGLIGPGFTALCTSMAWVGNLQFPVQRFVSVPRPEEKKPGTDDKKPEKSDESTPSVPPKGADPVKPGEKKEETDEEKTG